MSLPKCVFVSLFKTDLVAKRYLYRRLVTVYSEPFAITFVYL